MPVPAASPSLRTVSITTTPLDCALVALVDVEVPVLPEEPDDPLLPEPELPEPELEELPEPVLPEPHGFWLPSPPEPEVPDWPCDPRP